MSFTGEPDPLLAAALAAARGRGVVLVAAAGNAGPNSPPLFPASDPGVIAVTATDENDRLFPAANRGAYIAVAAPGVDVVEPAPNASYKLVSGTSVAAAHVSAVAALLVARKPSLRADEVRAILVTTARKPGRGEQQDGLGAGLTDALAAVRSVEPERADRATSAR
jgi:subtilisin family serine protease